MINKTILNAITAVALLSSITNAYASDYTAEMTDEIKLHVCKFLPFKSMRELGCTNKDWCRITNDKHFWVKIVKKFNPQVDMNIQDMHLNFIKTILTGQAKFNLFSFDEDHKLYYDNCGYESVIHHIEDDGQFVMDHERPAHTIQKFRGYGYERIPGTDYTEEFKEMNNAIGDIYASSSTTGKYQSFITTNFQTKQLIPFPQNPKIVSMQLNDIDVTGNSVVGTLRNNRKLSQGFYWNRYDDKIKVLTTFNSNQIPRSHARCVNDYIDFIGGSSVERLSGYDRNDTSGKRCDDNKQSKAAIWLGGYHFVLNDLLDAGKCSLSVHCKHETKYDSDTNLASASESFSDFGSDSDDYNYYNNYKFKRILNVVDGISLNGGALYGRSYDDSDKNDYSCSYWSLILPNKMFFNANRTWDQFDNNKTAWVTIAVKQPFG